MCELCVQLYVELELYDMSGVICHVGSYMSGVICRVICGSYMSSYMWELYVELYVDLSQLKTWSEINGDRLKTG